MQHQFTATATITIDAKAARVWHALTTPEVIKQYLFDTEVTSDWHVGSSLTFKGEWEGKSYEDKGVIKELIPTKRLTITYWSPMSGTTDSPENYATVTYDLEEKDSNTILTISQTNNATQEAADRSENNWNTVLASIKKIVESPEV